MIQCQDHDLSEPIDTGTRPMVATPLLCTSWTEEIIPKKKVQNVQTHLLLFLAWCQTRTVGQSWIPQAFLLHEGGMSSYTDVGLATSYPTTNLELCVTPKLLCMIAQHPVPYLLGNTVPWLDHPLTSLMLKGRGLRINGICPP